MSWWPRFLLILGVALGLAVAPASAAVMANKEAPCHQAPEQSDKSHDCCQGSLHCTCAMAALPAGVSNVAGASRPVWHARIPRLLVDNLYPPALPPPRA